jgi:hypothetical protein
MDGEPGGTGQGVNKRGGDAVGVSYSVGIGEGAAFQDGSYSQGGQGSASAGYVAGGAAGAFAGPGMAQGGAGGVDQTTIGDINISS